MCYVGKCQYYHWNDLNVSNVPYSFHFSLYFLASLKFSLLFFAISYVSKYSNINYSTTSLIRIHYNNIWFPCLDVSVTLDHNIPQNIHFVIFNNTFWSMFIPFFTSFQVVFPSKFPMNYSCNIIVSSLVLLLCQLFTFTHNMRYCFTFLVTHSTKSLLGCFIYLVFHIVCSNCLFLCGTQHGFRFNFQVSFSHVSFKSASSMFLFHPLFLAFLLQTVHAFFCFSIVPSFPTSYSV